MGCFVVDKGMFNKNGEPITALGYYHKDLNHVKSLTSIEEELDLLSRYREFRDPEAKRLLVEAHLLMVVRMAWKFSSKNHKSDVEDLIGSGNLGLLEAIEESVNIIQFEYSFSTFAKTFIKRAMINEMYNAGFDSYRLPAIICKTMSNLKKKFPKVRWGSENEPSMEMVVKDFYNESIARYHERHNAFPLEKYQKIILANLKWTVGHAFWQLAIKRYAEESVISKSDCVVANMHELDFKNGMDDDFRQEYIFGNPYCVNKFPSPDEMMQYDDLFYFVQSFLNNLPKIESEIFRRYLLKKDMAVEIEKDVFIPVEKIWKITWRCKAQLQELILLKQNCLDIKPIEEILELFLDAPANRIGHMRHKCIVSELERRLNLGDKLPLSNEDLVRIICFKSKVSYQTRSLKPLFSKAENELAKRFERQINYTVNKIMSGNNLSGVNITRDDLCQEAQIGLMKAIKLFDPSRGVKLATYAQHSIFGAIMRMISKAYRSGRKNKIIFVSLEGYYSNESEDERELVVPDLGLSQEEIFARRQHSDLLGENLKEVLSKLPEKERAVMSFLYPMENDPAVDVDDRTMRKAAIFFGFPLQKVQDIHKKSLIMIREGLCDMPEVFL